MKTFALLFFATLICSNCWIFGKGEKYIDEFAGTNYQYDSAKSKSDKIWSKVKENQTPYGWYTKVQLGGFFFESMSPSFDYVSDQIPLDRQKLIHSVGSVGKVEFVPSGVQHNYTGVLKGCKNVFLRISIAKQPNESKKYHSADGAADNYVPGFGIKFMRDNVESANLVAMYGVMGQSSWNYFLNDFSNHIPEGTSIALKTLGIKFATAQPQIGLIGLKPLADIDQYGNKESNINFPFKIVFRPTHQATSLFPDHFVKPHLDQFDDIPVGMTIYDVYAYEKGDDSNPTLLGSLKVTEKFERSYWGDRYMFFKHNYIEDDFKLKPHYRNISQEEIQKISCSVP
jgi:hypothetical protein